MEQHHEAHQPEPSHASHDEGGRDAALFERSMSEAREAVDRSRNMRQAILLRRVLRAFRRRDSHDDRGLDGGTDSTYHA